MKNLKWFSVLIALVTVGLLLTACTDNGPTQPVANSTSSGSSPSPNSSPSPAAAVPYPGAVDRSNCEEARGWVVNRVNPKAETKVEFYIDGKLIETLPAHTLRPDLTSWGSGLYGFIFKIPSAYKDDKPHVVSVKVAGTDYVLPFVEASPNLQCKPS